ncbi:MAG: succinyl-diaminopimelate desuccinylase [Pseudomonadota bacterium]|nr:succinyl-diaminopimelate desuccinylase [Pseudomonadota bacterium]
MADLSYEVRLTRDLIRCPSVTPAEGGALDLLQAELSEMGFVCTRLPFGEGEARIDNLFARLGDGRPHLAFAGHTDVVPAGNEAAWSYGPFSGEIKDGLIYGRGAADMKGGIAAFVAAVRRYLATDKLTGSLSLIITGDEEADAINGTVKMVDWMRQTDNIPDFCLVGEPTNPSALGQTIKNGRRGSLTCALTVKGRQGHVAYPHFATNPVPALFAMLEPVNSAKLDGGTDYFGPSTAEVTHLNIADPASNVIPDKAFAQFNIRFNTEHTTDSLQGWLDEHFTRIASQLEVQYEARFWSNASPFITEASAHLDVVKSAIRTVTGQSPELSTTGGTSDARFISSLCPVAEFGLVGQTMHQVDEHVRLEDIETLTEIYFQMIRQMDR